MPPFIKLKTVLYPQLEGKDSSHKVESGLLMNAGRIYHLNMEAVSSSTLSDAMNRCSPEIFRAMFENEGPTKNLFIRQTEKTPSKTHGHNGPCWHFDALRAKERFLKLGGFTSSFAEITVKNELGIRIAHQ